MAPFNKRQIGYIKAIANVGKHKSFIHSRYDGAITAGLSLNTSNSVIDTGSKACEYHLINLHKQVRNVDQTSSANDDISSWVLGQYDYYIQNDPMNLLDCPYIPEGDEGKGATAIEATTSRVGTEFFLDKTHLRMRFTMPDFQVASGKQPHYEYRLIIFRGRKPQGNYQDQNTELLGGASYINPAYDLFNGYVGRPVGIAGWRGRMDFDGHEHYSGMKVGLAQGSGFTNSTVGKTAKFPPGETKRTPDDLMTMPLNDADYVIKCDERFFLGPEHGKSHFEKVVVWDWNQQGETTSTDLSHGLDPTFNPFWSILVIGTSNDTTTPGLNILYRGTTTIESS